VLEVKGLTKRFGGVVAVDHVDLRIEAGELHCIVGPNGAGKSTFLSLLTGDARPTSGEIWLEEHRTDQLDAHEMARLGMMRKFQVPAVFPDLTVHDNLAVAAMGCASLRELLRSDRDREPRIREVLERTRLIGRAGTPAGELAHGEVQWLEIAMVLINRPRVLLLDEPTAGMTPAETMDTADLLLEVATDTSSTMVIVEHDMAFVRRVGQRITVLHKGAVLTQGAIDEIERDPRVRQVYLGVDDEGAPGAA
jgi:urea ABC transporter ATP-binding protein UrtD